MPNRYALGKLRHRAGSSRLPIVVIQHTAQSLAPPDCSRIRKVARFWNDQAVAQPLVIAFVMIMRNEFVNPFAQGILAKENHLIQAGFFDTAYESLRMAAV
jgi:hypothetical protein